ncbi:hypothetical protein BDV98DRAFT_569500 [Pterulicium gracile]|uniref:Uncharacterized protein n=1 Tax=Pterulicium gracile TaxID=1884261 RepID=A0A5C3QGI7_9AGAR|nr:hypothetical protein BDV98DRAFT_569500 [Pterula gracilis]
MPASEEKNEKIEAGRISTRQMARKCYEKRRRASGESSRGKGSRQAGETRGGGERRSRKEEGETETGIAEKIFNPMNEQKGEETTE